MNTGVNLAGAEGNAPEPEGYRTEMYRAPVPATLKGAKVVTTDEAVALWKDKETVFIDVLPYDPKPANLPAGTIWRDKMREDIPGSIWLANTGYGILNKETEAYFRKGLESRLGHEKNRRVLFYCMENCWMSWNAAKRAVEWGYRSVFWYPLGTDGWIAAGQKEASMKKIWTKPTMCQVAAGMELTRYMPAELKTKK
eukprot:gene6404-7956_t